MTVPETISLTQARRVALAAQGFADRAPRSAPTRQHLRRVLDRIGLIQVDSVNVLQRAHYLPLFSRLGSYPVELLDRAAYRRPRLLFEYWGHEASLLPVELHPVLRWRMARAHEFAWGTMRRIAIEQADLVKWVLQEVTDRGPVTAAEIERDVPRRRTDHWGWNWSDVKAALEWLFWSGEVAAARRNGAWTRVYDLPERVLPAAVLAAPTPTEAEAHRTLVGIAAQAMGVAAERELRDYFRLPVAGFRAAVDDLVEAGELLPVRVSGWRQRAWLHRQARVPRQVQVLALLSPFDPLVVLPFLLGDRLVARVDLKSDRQAGVLRIPAAWAEAGVDLARVASALAEQLWRLAAWLGLDAVAAPERGDLAHALAGSLTAATGVR